MNSFQEDNLHFILYATCIPTKGFKRGIIADLSNGKYRFIPLLLIEVLDLCREKSIAELKSHFNHSIDEGIDHYFSKLEKEGWGLFTKEPFLFPKLDLDWDSPLPITNFICDYNEESKYDIFQIIQQVQEINCEAIQFRFFCPFNLDIINKINLLLTDSCFAFVELIGGWNENIDVINYINILKSNPRIRRIIIHSSPFNTTDILSKEDYSQKLILLKDKISSHHFCGVIHEDLFAVNLSSYTESTHFNSCLNRKLSIDVNGNIKNCPSIINSFGHINDTRLVDIIKNDQIKFLWSINKDQIDICKDCEFKYICTDCRAFLRDKQNIYSKPFKCNYDPYEAIWTQ